MSGLGSGAESFLGGILDPKRQKLIKDSSNTKTPVDYKLTYRQL